MSIKPNKLFHFLLFIFLFNFAGEIVAQSDQKPSLLNTADSLFQQKKYTESLKVYEEILAQEKMASPQMLMKMAYVKEGLGDYSNALYYLDLYFQKTTDKKARNKMYAIAEEQNLEGFKSQDTDFFIELFNRHYTVVNLSVIALALFFASIGIYRKITTKPNAGGFSITSVVIFCAFIYTTNFVTDTDEGIIIENHAYLMTGPSAGADLVEIVQKGHKLIILNEEGPWLKVNWNDRDVYIRSSKVRKIG